MEDFRNPYTTQNVFGAIFVGASVSLTLHSIMRMAIMRSTALKIVSFPIINIVMLINEFAIISLTVSSSHGFNIDWYLWTDVIKNFTYFLLKPILLHLAFLRCCNVCDLYKKYSRIHYVILATRILELFILLVADIHGVVQCEVSGNNSDCQALLGVQDVSDTLEPIFTIYYVISEGIFYRKLLEALKAICSSDMEDCNIWRYLLYQVVLFTLDLSVLIVTGIYRVSTIANRDLPNYVYLETLSNAITIFVMTGFGLTIHKLRKSNRSFHNPPTEPEFINDPEKNPEYDYDTQMSTFGVVELNSFKQTREETSNV